MCIRTKRWLSVSKMWLVNIKHGYAILNTEHFCFQYGQMSWCWKVTMLNLVRTRLLDWFNNITLLCVVCLCRKTLFNVYVIVHTLSCSTCRKRLSVHHLHFLPPCSQNIAFKMPYMCIWLSLFIFSLIFILFFKWMGGEWAPYGAVHPLCPQRLG